MKLPGGIVGKACYVLMATAGSLAVICASTRTETVAYVAIGALLLIVLPVLWKLIHFAERKPEVAILEGAEFLAYQHMISLAQKGIGALPEAPPETPEPSDILILPADIEAARLPDPPPTSPPKRRKKDG